MHSPVLTIISFIVIFSVVVVSHEFGHFIIARLNGINVSEFTIGMGPALFKKKGKNTTFAIRLLPIGGACIFEGEPGYGGDEEDEDKEVEYKPGDYNAAPVWGRISTTIAGPVFNVILAYVLALFIVWVCGSDLPIVAYVNPEMPAAEAGIEAGDEIISIDGHRTHLWREIMVRSALNSGKSMEIVYERGGERVKTEITPAYSPSENRYYIGFSGGGDIVECRDLKLFPYSWYEVRYWLDATIQSLKYMITGHGSADDLSGPVGIAKVIDDTAETAKKDGGFWVFVNLVNITLLLSVNLGVMNLLPLPALDGGRLLFLIFEAVSGKKVPPEKEGFVHMAGFILLLILMVFVLYNDITKFFR